jgi:hypothetical protein
MYVLAYIQAAWPRSSTAGRWRPSRRPLNRRMPARPCQPCRPGFVSAAVPAAAAAVHACLPLPALCHVSSLHQHALPLLLLPARRWPTWAAARCCCWRPFSGGSVARLRMQVPTQPGLRPQDIQLMGEDFDGALLLPWLDANAAAVVALSANTGGCGDGCTAAGCQGCRSLFAACSSGVRSFLDGLHACPLCLLQIGGSC